MKILLSSVREECKTLELEAPLRLDGLEGRAEEGRIEATVEVDHAGDRWRLDVGLRGVFPFRCDRCSRAYDGELTGEFRLLVLSRMASGLEPDEDDAVVLLPAGVGELDLDSKIQEALWLDMPMTLSCEAAGDGDCPGPERDDEVAAEDAGDKKDQATDEVAIDPRWGPLAELKKQMEAADQADPTSRDEQRED
jgi:uncharacterized metal-binding protein YceD (DUF177 family)